MESYWLQQTLLKPNYPDLIWSRPENKSYAGKLLIIGGNSFGFSAPVNSYMTTMQAGVGMVRVILPESTKKLVGHVSSDVSYSPANLSGSFGAQALSDFLDNADWSDGTLIAGEIGNNSETVVLFEKFLAKYSGLVLLTRDSVELSLSFSEAILARNQTIVITDMQHLQKLQVKARELHPVNSSISLVNLVNNLHEFSINHRLTIVVEYGEFMVVASEGRVGTTKIEKDTNPNLLTAHIAVWTIQNPAKLFEAISCAAITAQSS